MADDTEIYLEGWTSRLQSVLLEYALLFMAGRRTDDIYPYRAHQLLDQKWDSPPHLQTVYSTINRLEEEGFLTTESKIVSGRVQKMLRTTNEGFVLMENILSRLKEVATTIEKQFQGG